MDRLKFRAWNPYHKRIMSPASIYEIYSGRSGFPSQCFDFIMQFTGLKDRNGNDIYEGDVVYIAGYGHYVCEFPFAELYDALPEGAIGAICGNIHENPELIEV